VRCRRRKGEVGKGEECRPALRCALRAQRRLRRKCEGGNETGQTGEADSLARARLVGGTAQQPLMCSNRGQIL
jgi:hypothetical protein